MLWQFTCLCWETMPFDESGPMAVPCSSMLPHCWHCRVHCGFRVKRTASNSGCLVRNSDGFLIFLLSLRSENLFFYFFPINLLHICDIFTGNSQLHLSNQHTMEMICSSWSSWVVVAQAHVWGLNREGYQKGLVSSPCPQHLSQYLHTKACTPPGTLPFTVECYALAEQLLSP